MTRLTANYAAPSFAIFGSCSRDFPQETEAREELGGRILLARTAYDERATNWKTQS